MLNYLSFKEIKLQNDVILGCLGLVIWTFYFTQTHKECHTLRWTSYVLQNIWHRKELHEKYLWRL
jgi:hypothetical protein